MGLKTGISLNPTDQKHFNDVIKHLEGIDVDIERIFERTAKKAVLKMKSDAPVDTGRLKRNIKAQREITGGFEISSEAIDPVTGEDYTFEQEFGGRNFPGTPYFFKNIRYFKRKIKRDILFIFRTLTQLKRVTR